jgi:hypothetical protein
MQLVHRNDHIWHTRRCKKFDKNLSAPYLISQSLQLFYFPIVAAGDGTQYNDTQYNDTRHNGPKCNTKSKWQATQRYLSITIHSIMDLNMTLNVNDRMMTLSKKASLSCDCSFIVLATVITIVNYNCTVITIVNYDHKTFIVQATSLNFE